MKSLKKILSLALVLMLIFSSMVFTAHAEDFTPAEEPVIYFEVPADWNYASIFCHIWEYGATEPFANWQSKKEKCTETDTPGVFSYDITAKTKLSLEEGKMYCVIFSADTGAQTYDSFFDTNCFGDALYCDGTLYENPADSSKTALAAFWKHQNPFTYGPVFQVTSIGNLVGTALPSNRTKADVFYDFLLVNLDNARTYSGKTDQQIVDTLVNGLELTTEKAIELIALSGVYVDWTPEGAASDDEFTPATDDEFKPATKDEATTEDELDDCTESFLLGDANMDGNVNIKDATYIQKAVAGLIMMTELENIAADADCSDDINIKDATTIQKHLAGMEIGYPLGVPMCYHAESGITHVITPETN